MRNDPEHDLCCDGLTITVPNRLLVDALSMDAAAGQILAILGPNGVGKSLLLNTLAGLRGDDGGRIELGGTLLSDLSRHQVARRLALLPQYTEDFFPSTVLDTVMIGRHPHIGGAQRQPGLTAWRLVHGRGQRARTRHLIGSSSVFRTRP